jgi:CheY-like chemotaxis protein
MSASDRSLFHVALLGFSNTERIMLSSMFRLSSRRLPSYSLSQDPFLSDIIVVNADDVDAVADLEQLCAERTIPSVWVGGGNHPDKVVITRPITWNATFEALDGIVQQSRVRDADLDASQPHTIPLGDWIATPGAVASVAIDPGQSVAEPDQASIPDSPWALVVAQDRRLRQFLAQNLALGGFNAEEIDDLRMALAMNAARDYFCVFVQADIPRVSGFSVCRLLQIQRKHEPRVVLVLPRKSWLSRLRARWVGAYNTLAHPLNRDAMRQLLDQLRREALSVKPK